MSKNAFLLRLPVELMEELKKISDLESRSVNKEIEYIIKKYIDDYKKNNS